MKNEDQVYLEVSQGFEHNIYTQLCEEMEAGDITEEEVIERSIKIHQEWCEDLEKYCKTIISHC